MFLFVLVIVVAIVWAFAAPGLRVHPGVRQPVDRTRLPALRLSFFSGART